MHDLPFYWFYKNGAIWLRTPIEAEPIPWLWLPRLLGISEGNLDTINALVKHRWQRVEPESHLGKLGTKYSRLWGQFANIRLVRMPGQAEIEVWVDPDDLARMESTPVVLAFTLPGYQPQSADTDTISIETAQALPPPQFGEIAMIQQSNEKWTPYTLTMLGDDGFSLWQRMSQAIKALAAPGEWWQDGPILQTCLRPGGYEDMRDRLRSRLLASTGQARDMVRQQLAELERAKKQAYALETAKRRADKHQQEWQERWQEIRTMGHDLLTLYWRAHQEATSIPATIDPETQADIEALAQIIDINSATHAWTTNYDEDRAVREAILAKRAEWKADSENVWYQTTNNMAVYFLDDKHPLSVEEAQAQLLLLRESTVLTARIALALWNLRRRDPALCRNGKVGITYDEILQWRGIKKHQRTAYPGTSVMRTDGFRLEDREDTRRDFMLLSRCYIRGQHRVARKDRYETLNVDAPYMEAAFVSRPTLWGDEHLGVFIAPGGWHSDYEESGNYRLAEVDIRIFRLNPQNDQHEVRLALFLVDEWRRHAKDRNYGAPITMAELLHKSVIALDKANLTSRFAPRIEKALARLVELGIVGSCEWLTPVNKNKPQWGKDWLAAQLRIMPPASIIEAYRTQFPSDARQPKRIAGKSK